MTGQACIFRYIRRTEVPDPLNSADLPDALLPIVLMTWRPLVAAEDSSTWTAWRYMRSAANKKHEDNVGLKLEPSGLLRWLRPTRAMLEDSSPSAAKLPLFGP